MSSIEGCKRPTPVHQYEKMVPVEDADPNWDLYRCQHCGKVISTQVVPIPEDDLTSR